MAEAGQQLMETEHYAVEEVKEKLVTLANEKTALLDLWEERRVLYEQCMDLQIFYRDTEQADAWMSKQVPTGVLKKFSISKSYSILYVRINALVLLLF